MKKNKFMALITASLIFVIAGCSDDPVTPEPPVDPIVTDKDYAEYSLLKVLQSDPVNIEGNDIVEKFDFFKTVRLKLYLTDGEPEYLEYTDGTAPFSPFSHVPEGKLECELDREAEPNVLKVPGSEIAFTIEDGLLNIKFKIDSRLLDYKYSFKAIE